MSGQAPESIRWAGGTMLLNAVILLAYLHQGLLLPSLPLFVDGLAGSALTAGVVLASFNLLSVLLRPAIGWWADHWDVPGVLTLGATLLAVCTLGLVVPLVPALILANALRGIGWAALNTAGTAVLAHAAPTETRGRAASYFALMQAVGNTFGPPFALWWLASVAGYASLFVLAAVVAFGGALLAWRGAAGRTLGHFARPWAVTIAASEPRLRLVGLLERQALLPFLLMASVIMGHPAVMAFVPLHARGVGIDVERIVWFYVLSGAASLVGRLLLGRVADRIGRGRAAVLGMALTAVGLAILAAAATLPWLVAGGAVYATAQALAIPAMVALAIDRAPAGRMGAAMATFTAAFPLGNGLGSLLAGYSIERIGGRAVFLVPLVFVLGGLLVAAASWKQLRAPSAPPRAASGP